MIYTSSISSWNKSRNISNDNNFMCLLNKCFFYRYIMSYNCYFDFERV